MTINSKKVDGKDIIRLLDISDRDKSALIKLLPYDVELMEVVDFYLNNYIPMKVVNCYPVRRTIGS